MGLSQKEACKNPNFSKAGKKFEKAIHKKKLSETRGET